MKFVTNILITVITIATTIVGSIWVGFEKIDGRMDDKINVAKVEVYDKIHSLRDERNGLIKAQDDKFSVQMVAVNTSMGEIKKDVRAILVLSRKAQAGVDKAKEPYYTKTEPQFTGDRL